MATKAKNAAKPIKVTYEPEEVPMYYSNVAQVTTSPYDVTIKVGRKISEKTTAHTLVVANAVQVYMSPQHARALMILLQSQLASYEEQFGPIPADHTAEDRTPEQEPQEN